jgi:hypothetical protein
MGQPEAQFGPLRTFVMGNSDHPHHAALTRRLQAYLRWRDANARHPDVLAAQRRERARIRSQRSIRPTGIRPSRTSTTSTTNWDAGHGFELVSRVVVQHRVRIR